MLPVQAQRDGPPSHLANPLQLPTRLRNRETPLSSPNMESRNLINSHLFSVQQLKQIRIFKPSPWTSQNHTTNQKRIIKTYTSRNNRVRQLQDTSNEQFMWFKKSDPWYAKDASNELLPGDSVHFDPCGWSPPAMTSLSPSPLFLGSWIRARGDFPHTLRLQLTFRKRI